MRPKPCRLASHPELRWRVAEKLALDWSPEQIAGLLKRPFRAAEGLRVSHETIYRSLFVQVRGVLRKELLGHLRAGRMRYPKGGTTPSRLPGQIIDAISIRERPAEIEDRAVPGHWEGDLLSGANNSYMATLVERHSRFAMHPIGVTRRTREIEVMCDTPPAVRGRRSCAVTRGTATDGPKESLARRVGPASRLGDDRAGERRALRTG